MTRLLGTLGFALLSLVAWAADDKITWEKADGVLAKAAAAGKPIIWYFVTNQFSKDALPPTLDVLAAAEKAFTNPVIVKRREPFLWVRGDQKMATTFKVQGAPGIVITDSDGEVLLRAPVATPENLFDAMQTLLKEKYVDTPVTWGEVVRTGPIQKKLLVVGFDDEKGEALKSLEDRSLVKYHKSCEFVKLPPQKGGESIKRWNVEKTPSIVICDAQERVLERVSGNLDPCRIKSAIAKALQKLDAPGGRTK